jgi:hypothetical protein
MSVTLAAPASAAATMMPVPAATTSPTTTTTSTTTTSTTTAPTTTSTTAPESTTSVDAESPSEATEPADGVTIGDLVWHDVDADGQQDVNEPGVAGVVVILRDATDGEVGRVSTDQSGEYRFEDLPVGSYRVEIELPADRTITTADQQSDDLDSDAVEIEQLDEVTRVGRTELFTVDGAAPADTIDVGLVKAAAEPPPTSDTVPDDTTAEPSTSAEPPTTESQAPTTTIAESTTTTEAATTTTIAATTTTATTVAPTTTLAAPPADG